MTPVFCHLRLGCGLLHCFQLVALLRVGGSSGRFLSLPRLCVARQVCLSCPVRPVKPFPGSFSVVWYWWHHFFFGIMPWVCVCAVGWSLYFAVVQPVGLSCSAMLVLSLWASVLRELSFYAWSYDVLDWVTGFFLALITWSFPATSVCWPVVVGLLHQVYPL